MTAKKSGSKKKMPARAVAPVRPKAISKTMPPVSLKPAPAGNVTDAFYIVGIGASAGGLEALDLFFSHMPPDSGMSFVLIPHLSPERKSMMAELLQRHTASGLGIPGPRHRLGHGAAHHPPPRRRDLGRRGTGQGCDVLL